MPKCYYQNLRLATQEMLVAQNISNSLRKQYILFVFVFV